VFKSEMETMDAMDKALYEVHVQALPKLTWPPL
jgi:hypothetical protein